MGDADVLKDVACSTRHTQIFWDDASTDAATRFLDATHSAKTHHGTHGGPFREGVPVVGTAHGAASHPVLLTHVPREIVRHDAILSQ